MRIAFVLCILMSHLFAFSQPQEMNDYILKHNQDTLWGVLDKKEFNKRKVCLFLHNEQWKEYFPDEILGFGRHESFFYSTEVLKNEFVEVIIKGSISLYRFSEVLGLQNKDEEVIFIPHKRESINIKYQDLNIRHTWKAILRYWTQDCVSSDIQGFVIAPQERSLINYVLAYNECDGSDFFFLQENIPLVRFRFGVNVGFVQHQLRIKQLGTTNDFQHLLPAYHSFTPLTALALGVSFPKFSERLSFLIEAKHTSTSFYSFFHSDEISIRDKYSETDIEIRSLSFPLQSKYMLYSSQYSLHIKGGPVIVYNYKHDSYAVIETMIRDNVYIDFLDSAMPINTIEFGFGGGFILTKPFKYFDMGIGIAYNVEMVNNSIRLATYRDLFSTSLYIMTK